MGIDRSCGPARVCTDNQTTCEEIESGHAAARSHAHRDCIFRFVIDVERNDCSAGEGEPGERVGAVTIGHCGICYRRAVDAHTHALICEWCDALIAVDRACQTVEPPVRIVAAIDAVLCCKQTNKCLAPTRITILHIQIIDRLRPATSIEEDSPGSARSLASNTQTIPACSLQRQCSRDALYPTHGEGEYLCCRYGLRQIMEHCGTTQRLIIPIECDGAASLSE